MHEVTKVFMAAVDDEEADNLLALVVHKAMGEKLAMKRRQGYGGWQTSRCNSEDLMANLRAHFEKGDMIDLINYAAMIHVRGLVLGDYPVKRDGGGER